MQKLYKLSACKTEYAVKNTWKNFRNVNSGKRWGTKLRYIWMETKQKKNEYRIAPTIPATMKRDCPVITDRTLV